MLLALDIIYSYTALMLLFGSAHLCFLLCGACGLVPTPPARCQMRMCCTQMQVCHGIRSQSGNLSIDHMLSAVVACSAWHPPFSFFPTSFRCQEVLGPLHILGSVDADITTHDLATGNTLRTDPPCCSSRRSPTALVRAWRWILCAPLRWRPAADGKLMALPG